MSSSQHYTDLIEFTNVSEDDMIIFDLAQAGYASITELRQMDTPEFLDLVEHVSNKNRCEKYIYDNIAG